MCLDIKRVPFYLDQALQTLTLNTEARTSFIMYEKFPSFLSYSSLTILQPDSRYWLPSLLKHKHVALQFLPQKSYETAAPMTVTPKADVITRVFMLFRGIPEDKLDKWTEATARANEDASFWVKTVRVDTARALDSSLYRILEWGGMEVLHD